MAGGTGRDGRTIVGSAKGFLNDCTYFIGSNGCIYGCWSWRGCCRRCCCGVAIDHGRRCGLGEDGFKFILDQLLDLVSGVGGFTGGRIVLLAVVLGDDEERLESRPSFHSCGAFPPTIAILIEEASGFDVIIIPTH